MKSFYEKYKWVIWIFGIVLILVAANWHADSNAKQVTSPTANSYQVSNHQTDPKLSNNNYYVNSSGNSIHSPAYSNSGSIPAGATARCSDGTYSFSQHHRGTCSHHGGVSSWLGY